MRKTSEEIILIIVCLVFVLLSASFALWSILNILIDPFTVVIGVGMSYLCYKAFRHFYNIYLYGNNYGN